MKAIATGKRFDELVDCYVLDAGTRMISRRSCMSSPESAAKWPAPQRVREFSPSVGERTPAPTERARRYGSES